MIIPLSDAANRDAVELCGRSRSRSRVADRVRKLTLARFVSLCSTHQAPTLRESRQFQLRHTLQLLFEKTRPIRYEIGLVHFGVKLKMQ